MAPPGHPDVTTASLGLRGTLLSEAHSLGSLMLSLGLAGPLCLPAATAQLHTVPPPPALIPAVDCSENRPQRETPISPAQNTVTPTAVPPFVSVHHPFLRKPTLTIHGLPLLRPRLWLHCVPAYHCWTLCRRATRSLLTADSRASTVPGTQEALNAERINK